MYFNGLNNSNLYTQYNTLNFIINLSCALHGSYASIVNDKHTNAEIEFDSFIMCHFLLAMKYAVSCFSKPFHSVGEIYLFI